MKPSSLAIFTSNDIYPTSADGHLPFKQHSDILFLSGADQKVSLFCSLMLIKTASWASLFLKETNDLIAVWEGAKYTKDEAFDISGIKRLSGCLISSECSTKWQ